MIKKYWLVVTVLGCFLVADTFVLWQKNQSPETVLPDTRVIFQLDGVTLNEMALTPQEQIFFQNREVSFTKKYEGKTSQGLSFTLLLVSSASWRTHHNPEICLQGMGYQIDRSELWQAGNVRVRKVTLQERQGTVLYWFANQDQIISDYSERVWAGILHPHQVWTLVEVGFNHQTDLHHPEIAQLIQKIQDARFISPSF